MEYAALSHCWGELCYDCKYKFCTSNSNLDIRKKGFSASELPKTFQDAVRVTQELRLKYLWIDSLCIIQWNEEDWEREAGRMEDVFSSAYLTIAATSAADSNAGFLGRNVDNEYIFARDAFGQEFYVCTTVSNFDMDVGEAKLNNRAWVLQERLLSRRTIHFTANQTYWECGEGVYCESLDILTTSNRKLSFTLDPSFPKRLLRTGHETTIEYINGLFEKYSKLGITQKTDRAVAISGLVSRISRARRCQSRYGILERYLHSNLLWQRHGVEKLEQISYNPPGVPSWSWMAYSGGIRPINFPSPLTVKWCTILQFDQSQGPDREGKEEVKKAKDALVTDLGMFHNCTLVERRGMRQVLEDSNMQERGVIVYDFGKSEKFEEERCVVVGRERSEYFILVVKPLIVGSSVVDGKYTRVGAGTVDKNYVVRDRRKVLIV